MILGKVVGTLTATRKVETLSGYKLLLIQPRNSKDETIEGNLLVAIDLNGAGVGEIVIIAMGHAARIAAGNEHLPVDATVVGIVDGMQMS